jgi:hypothetical protein
MTGLSLTKDSAHEGRLAGVLKIVGDDAHEPHPE